MLLFDFLKPILADGGLSIILSVIIGGILRVVGALIANLFKVILFPIIFPILIIRKIIKSTSNFIKEIYFILSISFLVKKGDKESITLLINELKLSKNRYKHKSIVKHLDSLTNTEGINVICKDWQETRNPYLENLIVQKNWIAQKPFSLKILTILKNGQLQLLPSLSLEETYLTLQYIDDQDSTIRDNIYKLDKFLSNDVSKSLFYFLTQQWNDYQKNDYDYSHIIMFLNSPQSDYKQEVIKTIYESNKYKWLLTITNQINYQQDINLITTGNNGGIYLWKIPNLIITLNGHTDSVNSIAINSKGTILASASQDKTVKMWDLVHQELIHTINTFTEKNLDVKMIKNADQIICIGKNNTIQIWQIPNKLINIFNGHNNFITCFEIHEKNNLLISASEDKTIKIWNLLTAELIKTIDVQNETIYCLKIISDGFKLFSGGKENKIKVWNKSLEY